MTPGKNQWRLEIHDAIGSTSDRCATLAAAGEPAGLAVLARRQTSGRGSRGRGWQSPIGNLSLSMLFRPDANAAQLGAWPLLTSIAVLDAARPLLPDPAVLSLKWPNDVLLRGRKLAGILIDTALEPDGAVKWLIIGTGVNLAVAPVLPDRPTASLADEGIVAPPPEEYARALLDHMARWHDVMQREGFSAIRTAWLARAHPLGTALTVTYGDVRFTGGFAGISDEGHLLLQTDAGLRTISTGEVLLFRPPG